jgi:hypothetical protein
LASRLIRSSMSCFGVIVLALGVDRTVLGLGLILSPQHRWKYQPVALTAGSQTWA